MFVGMTMIERATAVTNPLQIDPGNRMGDCVSTIRIERPPGGNETR
jgi:hypothetical protein